MHEASNEVRRFGGLRSLAEAEDDARAARLFLLAARGDWIVDLAPGDGERAWQVLRHLDEHGDAHGIRYLACCRDEAQRAALANIPLLDARCRAGRLVLACDLDALGERESPLVVLAHGAFSQEHQDRHAVHYGQLFEADPAADGWVPMTPRQGLRGLLAPYRRAINSAPLSLPGGAIARLERVLRRTGGRMLLRASDRGATSLTQIREGVLADPGCVNFEALARWHQAQGAAVHQSQWDDDGRVLHMALHGGSDDALRARFGEIATLPHPDAHDIALRALAEIAVEPAQCLALLTRHGADPRAALALADALPQAARQASGVAHAQWRAMLSRVHARLYPDSMAEARWPLAATAMHLHAWGDARRLLRDLLRAGADPVGCWRLLAECQLRSGAARAARISLRQALRACGRDDARREDLLAARDAVDARIAAQSRRPAYSAVLARDGELALEALDSAHASDLQYQYRDPQIGMMTRLPEFDSEEALRAWIVDRAQQRARLDCALMHAEHGFVGVVSAHWSREDAFMHFWVGADFQGRGFSARAARLQLRLLHAIGIRRVFTAVYPDNYRSLRTLTRCGFRALTQRALAPDEELLFFIHCDPALPDRIAAAHLRHFCRHTDSAFQFADDESTPVKQVEVAL